MNEDTQKFELARRAVASKHWRWMPGMRDLTGDLVVDTEPAQCRVRWFESGPNTAAWNDPSDEDGGAPWLPDLSDPATLGCVLALVREAWGATDASPRLRHGLVPFWVVVGWPPGEVVASGLGSGATEAEALVCALESK